MIQVKNLEVSINKKRILHDISFNVEKGTLLGLIGPNGSGKSTLLKTIASILPTSSGDIFINKKKQIDYKAKSLATQISYVPQETQVNFDFTAWDIVSMGRHVHRSMFDRNNEEDLLFIQRAMKMTETLPHAEKSVLELSSGQRQLVMIAKAFAQDTPIILLDEPISALDIYHQLHILQLLETSCEKEGKTMIVVLHDLNLAARFCHQLLLLKNGRVVKHGSPKEVLTKELLRKVYDVDAYIYTDNQLHATAITPFIPNNRKDDLQ